MGLTKGLARAVLEYELLSFDANKANATATSVSPPPLQQRRQHSPALPLGLFRPWESAELQKLARIAVCDLSEIMFEFPTLVERWLDDHCCSFCQGNGDDVGRGGGGGGGGEESIVGGPRSCVGGRLPSFTFRARTLSEIVSACIRADVPVGRVKKTEDGFLVTRIHTFSIGMLSTWLEDELTGGRHHRILDVSCGSCSGYDDAKKKEGDPVRVVYYTIDGATPAAKTLTSKRREAQRFKARGQLVDTLVERLGDRAEALGMIEDRLVTVDGVEMICGSVENFVTNRRNVLLVLDDMRRRLALYGRSEENSTGSGPEVGRDVFVIKGSMSSKETNSWFRISGNNRAAQKPLEAYCETNPNHFEADQIMPRIADLADRILGGPILMRSADSDTMISLLAVNNPNLVWAVRLPQPRSSPSSSSLSSSFGFTPMPQPQLRSKQRRFRRGNGRGQLRFFSVLPPTQTATKATTAVTDTAFPAWQEGEVAARRLSVALVLASGGCDFTPGISNYGPRRIVDTLRLFLHRGEKDGRNKNGESGERNKKKEEETLSSFCFGDDEATEAEVKGAAKRTSEALEATAETIRKTLTVRRGARCGEGSDNLELVDAIARQSLGKMTLSTPWDKGKKKEEQLLTFPWRFGDHLCVATVNVSQLARLFVQVIHDKYNVKSIMSPRAADGEARRLAYSVMVLSANATCPETKINGEDASGKKLARLFGYDPDRDFALIGRGEEEQDEKKEDDDEEKGIETNGITRKKRRSGVLAETERRKNIFVENEREEQGEGQETSYSSDSSDSILAPIVLSQRDVQL